MFRIISLIFLFILKLRFPRNKPLSETIIERYGRSTLQLFRKYESRCFKLKKSEADREFLVLCKSYNVVPKFMKFKLYKKSLYSTPLYNSWTNKLLMNDTQ